VSSTSNGYGALDIARLDQAAREAGMPYCTGSINHVKAMVSNGLTPEEIRHQRSVIEFLICELSSLDTHFRSRDDTELGLHNALIWRAWQELDVLTMWAGGQREYGRHGHWEGEECGDAVNCARNEFARACNRLYAEVEPGAHIAQIEITMHTADGTEVSYATSPRPLLDGSPQAPIWRTIHAAGHDGCVDATIGDTPDADETSGEE